MRYAPKTLTPYVSARHYFGSEQRRHREVAKLSLVQLADIVNSSKSNLARVETAELMPPPELPSALDAAFGTERYFFGLYQLAKKEIHPDRFRRYMEFESQATVIEDFATNAVPGLLQTRAYAHAFFGYWPGATAEQVEERVQARLLRQERLRSVHPPRYSAILDEAILHRPVGGPEVMREQLAALLAQIDTSHTMIQVLPFLHGGYALMEGPLKLLTLPSGQGVAYEEGRMSGDLLEVQGDVAQRRALYDSLRAYALSPRDSAALIQHLMERYEPCAPAST
ncbi:MULTISPECIES: helix-turn-helix domain-containing protein [Streptomyces]|uniref:helix-turn-helix domain-containing protein n=1 Tax=Streptomyces TaxID=1883 RepID=UPI001F282B27|nr:helix-turn-helix transcriptional regulator [Streptomyces noursei]MCE4943103.1 helix-turn-helix transcriptional regulator [Streptomyces noursei]